MKKKLKNKRGKKKTTKEISNSKKKLLKKN
jgi:hypothetical protein